MAAASSTTTTAAAIKDLGYVAWRDPYSWMESMKGERWRALVQRENQAFQEAVKAASENPDVVEAVVSSFLAAEEEAESLSGWVLKREGVRVVPYGGGLWSWTWSGATGAGTGSPAADLDTWPAHHIVYTRLRGTTGDRFEVVAQKGNRILWRRGRTGPSVAFLKGRVYFLEETAPLRFDRLVSVDAGTGTGRRVLYEEADRSAMLTLLRGEGQCLFLVSENAGRQRLFWITGELKRLCEEGVSFFPVGAGGGREGGEPNYFFQKRLDGPWMAAGHVLERWRLPALAEAGLDAVSLGAGLVVLKEHGRRSIWRCGERREPVCLRRFVGEVQMHPWAAWHGGSGAVAAEMLLTIPGAAPIRLGQEPQSVAAGSMRRGVAKSADGASVHWIYVWNANLGPRPRALMAIVYGAYNVATSLSTARWRPYLERGWAIGFAFVRGGGDDSAAWAEAGRREGKVRGVDDFVAALHAMREAGEFPAERVCVYGRSAGGYIVGAAVARYPKGELFRGAYTEVPYVDVLNTAANPALPLTEYEYMEFGNPRVRIRDLETMVRESPVQALGPKGAPGVFVLCRTAADDLQVFAYESAKWVEALRGAGSSATAAKKLLAVSSGQGHHAHGLRRTIERTEDFLILQKEIGE